MLKLQSVLLVSVGRARSCQASPSSCYNCFQCRASSCLLKVTFWRFTVGRMGQPCRHVHAKTMSGVCAHLGNSRVDTLAASDVQSHQVSGMYVEEVLGRIEVLAMGRGSTSR